MLIIRSLKIKSIHPANMFDYCHSTLLCLYQSLFFPFLANECAVTSLQVSSSQTVSLLISIRPLMPFTPPLSFSLSGSRWVTITPAHPVHMSWRPRL